jgi:hypothetical protein
MHRELTRLLMISQQAVLATACSDPDRELFHRHVIELY